MVVTFWRTTRKGSAVVGRVDDKGNGPQALVDLLLSSGLPLAEAMRDAPRRFNGAYLRAELTENAADNVLGLKQSTPTGSPLPDWEGQVEITPEQVAEALRDWDAKLPRKFRGLRGLLMTERPEGG